MAKMMSKSQIIQKIADQHSKSDMTRKDVKDVIESLAKIGYAELKKSGIFVVPGFAKFVVIKKPATPERSPCHLPPISTSHRGDRRGQRE